MNFSTYFLDKLNSADKSLGLGYKKGSSALCGFADIIKVCENENTLVRPTFSTQNISRQDVNSSFIGNITSTSKNNLSELSQVVSAFLSNSGNPIESNKIVQKFDTDSATKSNGIISSDGFVEKQFLIPVSDLQKFLSELVEKIDKQGSALQSLHNMVTTNSGQEQGNAKTALVNSMFASVDMNQTLNLSFKSSNQKLSINISSLSAQNSMPEDDLAGTQKAGLDPKIILVSFSSSAELNPGNILPDASNSGNVSNSLFAFEDENEEPDLPETGSIKKDNTGVIQIIFQSISQPQEFAPGVSVPASVDSPGMNTMNNFAANIPLSSMDPVDNTVAETFENGSLNAGDKLSNVDTTIASTERGNSAPGILTSVNPVEVEQEHEQKFTSFDGHEQEEVIKGLPAEVSTFSEISVDELKKAGLPDGARFLSVDGQDVSAVSIAEGYEQPGSAGISVSAVDMANKTLPNSEVINLTLNEAKTVQSSNVTKQLTNVSRIFSINENISVTDHHQGTNTSGIYVSKNPGTVSPENLFRKVNPETTDNSAALSGTNDTVSDSKILFSEKLILNHVFKNEPAAGSKNSNELSAANPFKLNGGAESEISELTKLFSQIKFPSTEDNSNKQNAVDTKQAGNKNLTAEKVVLESPENVAIVSKDAADSTIKQVSKGQPNSLSEKAVLNDNLTATTDSIGKEQIVEHEQALTNQKNIFISKEAVAESSQKVNSLAGLNDTNLTAKRLNGEGENSSTDNKAAVKADDTENVTTVKESQAKSSGDKDLMKQNNDEKNNFVQNLNDLKDISTDKIKNAIDVKAQTDAPKTIKTSEIVSEFSKFIQHNGDKQSISFQLSPENLGKVKLVIDLIQNHVNTHIEVENDQARQIIQQNVEQLRANLQSSGIQLNTVNISLANHEQNTGKRYTASKKYSPKVAEVKKEIIDTGKQVKSMGYNTYEFLA